VGNLEEVVSSGGSTTTTTYYYAGGQRIALAVNGVFSYLASDALGTPEVSLSVSGSAQASQLYAPYGSLRYSQGTMPTDYGFTGQRSDATTGLQYFGSRFYDPSAGQFVSADTTLPGNGLDPLGLSRYAYVEGNPVARTDPSGHYMDDGSGGRAFQNYNTGAITYYPVHTAPVYIPPPPARRNSPHVPSIPPSPCQRMPWLCVNAQPSQEAASRPVPRVSVLGCGSTGLVCLSWGRGVLRIG
jgi:RHS repeat-associated protein